VKDVTQTAIIVGIFFLVGVIFGVLLVVAMSAIRSQPKQDQPVEHDPEINPDTGSSRWPDLTP
jgi:hypothetical protein